MAKRKVDPVVMQSAASAAGFHFVHLYQCCQRKFYFRWVLGLEPMGTAMALLVGAAFHEGKAEWYRTGNEAKAMRVATMYFRQFKHELENILDAGRQQERMERMLDSWIAQYGRSDLENYEVLSVEKERSIVLPGGYVYTGRPDTTLRMDGIPTVMETKTSGYDSELTLSAVVLGDQATSYLALCADDPEPAKQVICDVTFNSSRGGKALYSVRSEPITRDALAITAFKAGIAQVFSEISQKTEAMLQQKVPGRVLFARNTYYCVSYNKMCEYAGICARTCTLKEASIGFKRVKKEDRLGDYLLDSIVT